MTITYYMSNATPNLVKTIMVRKFFQMVFVGNDRKSLHIYTASVLGGCPKVKLEKKKPGAESTNYVSQLDKLNAFRMKFDFVVRGNDNNDVLSIESEDITDGDRGFLSQIEYIRQVWGDECEIIRDNQGQLDEVLGRYLPSRNDCGDTEKAGFEGRLKEWKIEPGQTAELAGRKILYIGDEKKKREGEMFGLALAGNLQKEDYSRPLERRKGDRVPEGSEHASYCIQVPQDVKLVPGIELVNWVKTTIRFRYRFHDSNLNFCIQKKAKSETEVQYIAPDSTWYFSPPVKAFINNESSSVELKLVTESMDTVQECKYRGRLNEGNTDCELPDCTCPIKKLGILTHTTTRHPNVINPVANKTTVNFKQWTDDEMISFRQKYRLAVKNIFTQNVTIDNTNEINIFLDTTDEHGRGNRQFVLGLFISFALAFGIDSNRLEKAGAYFPLPNFLEADAWWLILLVLLSLNVLIRPPRAEREWFYYRWRILNLGAILLWAGCVFIVLRSELLRPFLLQWQLPIEIGFRWIYGVLFFSSVVYIYKNIKKYHDPILSSLFNDDIL